MTGVGRSLAERADVFHWHGETFELPDGAVHLARSRACENQAFALGDRVIGLQYHLEITVQSAGALIDNCRDELVDAPYVQTEEAILSRPERFDALNSQMSRLLSYFLDANQDR